MTGDMPPKMKRFLAHPPRRISEAAIRNRKGRTCGSGLRRWLPGLTKEQGGLCFYCKVRITPGEPKGKQRKATLDHYIPLSRGGPNALSNCVAACAECNQAKGNMPAEVFMAGKKAREEYTAARVEMWRHANALSASRDSDGSSEAGETGTGSTEGNSPGRRHRTT